MARRWVLEHKADAFYRQAKREGYRSRASFKLMQINERFGLLKSGQRVLDLGAAPGGWLQVAKEIVGEDGLVVGVDLLSIAPLEGIVIIRGDMTDEETIQRVMHEAGGEPFDVVLSDMSPDISGAFSTDHARSVHLAQMALETAKRVSRPGGGLILKVFQGDMLEDFLSELKRSYHVVRRVSPKASRARSAEIYIVCMDMRKPKQ